MTTITNNEATKPEAATHRCNGGHQAVSVNAKGWCNLCLKDLNSGKPAGTTARARGLR